MKNKYPFNEGESYWTIENDISIKSVWDNESEKLHTANKEYFFTELESLQYLKIMKLDYLLCQFQISLEKIAFNDDVDYKQEAKDCLECMPFI